MTTTRDQPQIDQAVILFGKFPRAGHVKTRLAATIGSATATEFYRRCLQSAFGEVMAYSQLTPNKAFFCFDNSDDAGLVRSITPEGIELLAQTDGLLPVRIEQAFNEVFNRGYQKVIICATDVPTLNSELFGQAMQGLITHDTVLGRDSDDGYYVLGAKQFEPLLFDVQYGSAVGMYQLTKDRATHLDLSLLELPQQNDVDTLNDLNRFRQQNPELWKRYYKSIRYPTSTL